jgi:hypothetical protein
MKNKINKLYSLAIIIAGVICLPAQAQQKSGTHRADFSGEWKSKESIAMGGNIVCSYNSGDRMLAKTMKITESANSLIVTVSSAFPGTTPVAGEEKLTLDGKTSETDHAPGRTKKFTAKRSADGQTLTINSTVQMTMNGVQVTIPGQKQDFQYVTEVWKLSNDGRTITVQANAKSNSFGFGGERAWKTLFYRVR